MKNLCQTLETDFWSQFIVPVSSTCVMNLIHALISRQFPVPDQATSSLSSAPAFSPSQSPCIPCQHLWSGCRPTGALLALYHHQHLKTRQARGQRTESGSKTQTQPGSLPLKRLGANFYWPLCLFTHTPSVFRGRLKASLFRRSFPWISPQLF